MTEPETEEQIVARFQELRQELQQMQTKIDDLDNDAQEHELVVKTLEPMDPSRKAYRLIGDVLVERTVAEVLPAVKRNRENLGELISNMQQQVEKRKEGLQAFQQKYKIRIRSPAEAEEGDRKEAKSRADGDKPSGAAQGVLV